MWRISLLLLLVVSPARAFFTTAEYASLKATFVQNDDDMDDIWASGLNTMIAAGSTTAENAYTREVWRQLVLAEKALAKAIGYMLDVEPVDPPVLANRAARVSAAVTEVTAYRTAVAAVNTQGVNCVNDGASLDATFRFTGCLTVRDFSAGVVSRIDASWNSGLAYTNPHGPWYPQVLGPHGDFDDAVFDMITALTTAADGMEDLRKTWDWNTNSESAFSAGERQAFGRIALRVPGNAMRKMSQMMLRYGLLTTANTTTSPLRAISDFYEGIIAHHSESQSRTHTVAGLPYHYDQVAADSFAVLNNAMPGRTTARGFFKTGWHKAIIAAWRFSDGSVWHSFKFPDETTLQTLRAQKNQANDPGAAPISKLEE